MNDQITVIGCYHCAPYPEEGCDWCNGTGVLSVTNKCHTSSVEDAWKRGDELVCKPKDGCLVPGYSGLERWMTVRMARDCKLMWEHFDFEISSNQQK